MRDWFGHAVAISGDTAVVSAYEFGGDKLTAGNVRGGGPGKVYIYRRDGLKGFNAVQDFKSVDTENDDRFGYAIDLSGEELLAIGSPFHDEQKGSVYVFDTENPESLDVPLSVEPRGDLVLTMFGDIKRTALLQNFPNPFNPETWIPYTLADDADVNIRIYDVQGKLVRQLDIGQQRSGRYFSRETAAYWNGKDQLGESVSSGVYFYTLKADGFSDTRRMVILK